jgi:hypothetical protein
MSITPVSRERHGGLRWRRAGNYAFAAHRMVVPLVASELGSAAAAFPIAFAQQGSLLLPVAVVGVQADVNVFVGEDGQWRGRYLPATLRAYPFSLLRDEEGRQVLCIEEDPKCLTEESDSQPFFAEEGKPCDAVLQVLDFLSRLERNRRGTAEGCKALYDAQCIQPWPITVHSDSGEQKLQGFFRVDERALNGVSDEAFLAIRRAGGLPIAYAQLFSMQQLPLLGEMAAARAQHAKQVRFGQDLDLSWLNSDIFKLG